MLTYLVADHGLLNSGKILEGLQQDMCVLCASKVFHKITQLASKGQEDFIFVINRFCSLHGNGQLRSAWDHWLH